VVAAVAVAVAAEAEEDSCGGKDMKTLRLKLLAVAGLIACLGCSVSTKLTSVEPQVFSSPQAALDELVRAVQAADMAAGKKIFGSEGEYLLSSGDKVMDQN
jgi:hypothetical protein